MTLSLLSRATEEQLLADFLRLLRRGFVGYDCWTGLGSSARYPTGMTGVRIVRLTADEGERLRRIRLAALREAPKAFGSSYAETAARPLSTWRRQLIDLATFLAVRDGRDVGMVRGAPSSEASSAAELLSMWVEPSARGRGVGEALIRAVEEWACDQGFSRLLLVVYAENLPARRLYARMGFVATGDLGGDQFGRDLDCAEG